MPKCNGCGESYYNSYSELCAFCRIKPSSPFKKYPRTLHLPWSPGCSKDVRGILSPDFLIGEDVVITEKMDGENTSLYSDFIHARSLDYSPHWSRSRVKGLWAAIRHRIPNGHRICGENMYATHSIYYENLEAFFLGFSVWDPDNVCRPWDETTNIFWELGIQPVPELWRGKATIENLKNASKLIYTQFQEGFVVRPLGAVPMSEFQLRVGKWVRPNHVKSDHWRNSPDAKRNCLRLGLEE